MKQEYTLLTENNGELSKALFSVVGLINAHGFMKIVIDDPTYRKFTEALLRLRVLAKEADNSSFVVDDDGSAF